MELTYTQQGDYLIPDLTVPESPKIGKYGMLRRTYLREHRDGLYTGMLLSGKLNSHLEEIDRQANEMMARLTSNRTSGEIRCPRRYFGAVVVVAVVASIIIFGKKKKNKETPTE